MREKVAEGRLRGQQRLENEPLPPHPGPLPQGEGMFLKMSSNQEE